ncbi:MAG: YcxB family protein [Eubacteriales bacterium]
MDRMDIVFKLKYENMYEVLKANFDKTYFHIINIVIFIGTFTFGIPFIFDAAYFTGRGHFLLSFVLAVTNFFAIYFIRLQTTVKPFVKKFVYKHSVYSKQQKMEIYKEGITTFNHNFKENINWEQFRAIVELKTVFCLDETNGSYHCIPKTAFTQEQLDAFRSWTNHIEKKHEEFSEASPENDSWEYVDDGK